MRSEGNKLIEAVEDSCAQPRSKHSGRDLSLESSGNRIPKRIASSNDERARSKGLENQSYVLVSGWRNRLNAAIPPWALAAVTTNCSSVSRPEMLDEFAKRAVRPTDKWRLYLAQLPERVLPSVHIR